MHANVLSASFAAFIQKHLRNKFGRLASTRKIIFYFILINNIFISFHFVVFTA